MKNKIKELDVDFIGGQSELLTIEEQHSISAFIKKLKESRLKKARRKRTKSEKQIA